jgi:hypothetical protein
MSRTRFRLPIVAVVLALAGFAAPLAGAENRTPNPELDLNVDHWTAVSGARSWMLFDADGCHTTVDSGGLNLESAQSGPHQAFSTHGGCIEATAEETVCFGMKYNNGGANVTLSLRQFTDAACGNSAGQSNAIGGPSPSGFAELSGCTTLGAGTLSFWIETSSLTPNTTSGFTMVADRFYVLPGIRVFGEDFETESLCRWD